jgi:hypothetical protein
MDDKQRIENQMAEWLAHPNEFGVGPKTVRYLRAYKLTIVPTGDTEVHLVEYEMPDGTKTRGFVNPPLTWSFIGDVSKFSDHELLLAYCGWSWLFPRIQAGTVLTKFISDGEEARYITQKRAQGFSDVKVTARYKIGTSEIFEVEGVREGKPAKSAGNTETDRSYGDDSPQFALPAIYSFLGPQVIKAMR